MFSRPTQLEFDEDSLKITAGKKSSTIELSRIKGTYFTDQSYIHRIIALYIVTDAGETVTLSASRFALISNGQFETAKAAIAAFFARYHQAHPNVEVVLGFPRTATMAAYWAGITVFALGVVLYSMIREGMMSTPVEVFTVLGVFLFTAAFMGWHFHRNTGARRESARDIFERLST